MTFDPIAVHLTWVGCHKAKALDSGRYSSVLELWGERLGEMAAQTPATEKFLAMEDSAFDKSRGRRRNDAALRAES